MSETHAEIKDVCDGIQNKLDEIVIDIREASFNYKIIEQYSDIDEEVYEIYDWYEKNKKMLENYEIEKNIVNKKLKELDTRTRFLNNEVQNTKYKSRLYN